MDVLASDSERLTEVDTDDTASVARYILHTSYHTDNLQAIFF